MTGGACQPGGEQSGLQQNALTGLMDQMIMGNARAQQQMAGYQNPQQMQNAHQMSMMDQHYQQMLQQDMMCKFRTRLNLVCSEVI